MNLVAASNYRPGRALAVLALLIVVLLGLLFWPGNDKPRTPQLGLDLRGGTSVTLQATAIGEGTISNEAVEQAVDIIRQRVDGLGVAEAEVTTQTSDSGPIIVVSVPGVNQSRIVELVGQTAQLNFRPVIVETVGTPTSTNPPAEAEEPADDSSGRALTSGINAAETPAPTSPADATATPEAAKSPLPIQAESIEDPEFQAAFASLDCTNEELRVASKPDDPDLVLATCSRDGSAKYVLDKAAVLGSSIDSASADLTQQGVGQWVVNLQFDSEGARQFAETTASLVGQTPPQNQFGIVLDGLVVSAPAVNEAISGGQAQISGSFNQADAQDLASILKFGALPLAFTVQQVESVSPTLGTEQLRAGVIAALLGLLLVAIFLLLYYRVLGFVAVFSLLIAAALTYLAFVLLGQSVGFTLTLAGVTGAIIAIGITADSFIVYFERIRDELREGKTLRASVEAGWLRGRRTILAADFVSLLAATVLYFVSVGNVRGFAFALGLTTLIDVLVVFVFTRPMVVLASRRPFFAKGHPMSGVDPRRLGLTRPEPKQDAADALAASNPAKEA